VPLESGSAAGQTVLVPPYYSQHAVFASLLSAFFIIIVIVYYAKGSTIEHMSYIELASHRGTNIIPGKYSVADI